jgi:hypothetical protein
MPEGYRLELLRFEQTNSLRYLELLHNSAQQRQWFQ